MLPPAPFATPGRREPTGVVGAAEVRRLAAGPGAVPDTALALMSERREVLGARGACCALPSVWLGAECGAAARTGAPPPSGDGDGLGRLRGADDGRRNGAEAPAARGQWLDLILQSYTFADRRLRYHNFKKWP